MANAAEKLPFVPVRYEWTVPTDPSGVYPMTTAVPFLRWPYPVPGPERASTSHVFVARAIGPAGEVLEGRGSAAVSNPYYIEKVKLNQLMLAVRSGPPLPVDGQDVMTVTLTNPYAEAISLDTVAVSKAACGPREPWPGPPGSEPPGGNIKLEWSAGPTAPATTIVPTTQLAPGASTTFKWSLPSDTKRCDARVDLYGLGTQSGIPARGAWLMPTGPQARGHLAPGEGPRMRAAAEILKKRRGTGTEPLVITPQDLTDLEAEGLIPPAPPPGQEPPPPPPPPAP
jgi:hypothetical protein